MSNTPKPNAQTSGAPETKPANRGGAIWNERNELVDPEMIARLNEERDLILGNENAPVKRPDDFVPPTPEESQRKDSQTSEPLTNPLPVHDPRSAPTFADKPDLAVGDQSPERLPQFAPITGGSEREAGKVEQESRADRGAELKPAGEANADLAATPNSAPPQSE